MPIFTTPYADSSKWQFHGDGNGTIVDTVGATEGQRSGMTVIEHINRSRLLEELTTQLDGLKSQAKINFLTVVEVRIKSMPLE